MLEDHRQPAADPLQLPGIGGAQLAQGAGTGAQFLVADADVPGRLRDFMEAHPQCGLSEPMMLITSPLPALSETPLSTSWLP
jgi:hypothetical protein